MLESDEISSESDRLPIELIERDLLINSDDTMLVCVQKVNWLHRVELSLHSTNEIEMSLLLTIRSALLLTHVVLAAMEISMEKPLG